MSSMPDLLEIATIRRAYAAGALTPAKLAAELLRRVAAWPDQAVFISRVPLPEPPRIGIPAAQERVFFDDEAGRIALYRGHCANAGASAGLGGAGDRLAPFREIAATLPEMLAYRTFRGYGHG